MSPGDLVSLFGGAGGGSAVIFCILFLTNQIYTRKAYEDVRDERDEWRRIAELERARADAGVIAGQVIKDVLTSLPPNPKELK